MCCYMCVFLAEPSVEPLYGDCMYKEEAWYAFGTQWRAGDGCNTCYCFAAGDFTGAFECTKTKCNIK